MSCATGRCSLGSPVNVRQAQGLSGGTMARVPKGFRSVSTLNPQQANILSQILQGAQGQNLNVGQSPIFQSGSSFLQNLFTPNSQTLSALEAPLMRQFQQEILPSVAERFAGVGALSSSGFQNALSQASTDLATNLGALRAQAQLEALPEALKFSMAPLSSLSDLLNMQTFSLIQKPQRQPGFLKSLGLGLGSMFTGGLGNVLGQGLGNKLGKFLF